MTSSSTVSLLLPSSSVPYVFTSMLVNVVSMRSVHSVSPPQIFFPFFYCK